MTALEIRFDTILPTLATKEDFGKLELKLVKLELDIVKLELKLTDSFQQECKSIRQEMNTNHWRMIVWMTAVMSLSFTGVFYVARYLPA